MSRSRSAFSAQVARAPVFASFCFLIFAALGFASCSSKPTLPSTANHFGEGSPAKVSRSFYLMGTSLEVELSASTREEALAASEAVFETVRADELRLSTWKPESELSKLNRAKVGQKFRVSPLLKRDLQFAIDLAEKTNFAFNPFIGPLVDAWGVRTSARIPSSEELRLALQASHKNAFTLCTACQNESYAIRKYSIARIEEGGFGKGIALDDAVEVLQKRNITQAVLNFGGQIAILGSTEPVEIANPAKRDEVLVKFQLASGSVATSGNSEHGQTIHPASAQSGGRPVKIGHLLNPFTGKPAPFEGSITILAPHARDADALTKIFVLGVDQGMKWANAHGVAVLWILPESIESPEGDDAKNFRAYRSHAWAAPLQFSKNCHPATLTGEPST